MHPIVLQAPERPRLLIFVYFLLFILIDHFFVFYRVRPNLKSFNSGRKISKLGK